MSIDGPVATYDDWYTEMADILDCTRFTSNLEWLRWFNKNHLDYYMEATKPLEIPDSKRIELKEVEITKSFLLQNYHLRNWLRDTKTEGQIFKIEDFEYGEGIKPVFNLCHRNVEIAIELFGGRGVSCYQIRRFRKTCFMKMRHSIWEDNSGCLRDISPEHPLDPPSKGRLVGFPKNMGLDFSGTDTEKHYLISPCYVKNPFFYNQFLSTGLYELEVGNE